MKKIFLIAILSLAGAIAAHAQVFILNDNVLQQRMGTIKAAVLDSLTNEPVSFASVYVVPSKDTTITNFTLTDAKGEAKLEEVPFGSYVFHVEMMGYKPFVKERYFRDRETDMGTIRLQQDEQFLQAAVVSDIGNPIVVKQDTVEFNASSFRVGSNAMLKDLLQRMPGMEITEDGKVKFNGEEIDKLTVGGRTFFFKDQSTALNNLPASVVDKIRVIDRESEQTRASGIQDGSREKVLDVGLKKEYEKGWFGNVGIKGGTTLGEKDGDDVLRDNKGLLWSGNALVSAYTDKDQLTVIANGQNINDSNAVIVMVDEDGERTSSTDQGLSTAAQLGVNANTSRIKDVGTTFSVNYKYADTDSGTRADRTTYQEDGDLATTTENFGKSYTNSLSANAEFEKEEGKIWFHIRSEFRYNRSDATSTGTTETTREGTFLNNSENSSHSLSTSNHTSIDTDVTFREIGGKKGRTVRVGFYAIYNGSEGESSETSSITTSSGRNGQTMTYDSRGSNYSLSGEIRYTEPLGDKWRLSADGELSWGRRDNTRNAFDALGLNDYYSSVSNSKTMEQEYSLTAQYQFGERSFIGVGGQLSGVLNETFSKSYGIEATTGKDAWNWFVTPSFRFQHSKGNDRFNLDAFGYTQRPSSSRMLPVLNISNPSRLSLGNVYLEPSSYTHFSASWTRNNRERFSNLMAYLYGQLNSKPVVSALWYDADGILYSIPVNSTRPGTSSSLVVNYTTPLDAKKLWSLTLSGTVGYSSTVSYQAKTTFPALDKDSFDYSAFMADFWGDDDGDRFYGGESGFAESRTHSFAPSAGVTVKYNPERWSVSAGAQTTGRIARYSLNPDANLNTLKTSFFARGSYTTKHEFEFNSDIAYVFYKGYSAGYGQPEWQWNAEISKNIGAFNLNVSVHDILNQTRNLTHTVTANYEEDSYRLIMGRYVLFGLKWNFGKMNATHSQRAQQAAFNMVF
ncbi:MAG: outer membrane beta-barrel protein [Candidatus Cryptobacteroides sp.]